MTAATGPGRLLERLLSDADLRERLGSAGRATVKKGYTAAVVAPRVAEIFHAAVVGS
jgi:hypothetical protein